MISVHILLNTRNFPRHSESSKVYYLFINFFIFNW